jgi:hypothetical protein
VPEPCWFCFKIFKHVNICTFLGKLASLTKLSNGRKFVQPILSCSCAVRPLKVPSLSYVKLISCYKLKCLRVSQSDFFSTPIILSQYPFPS